MSYFKTKLRQLRKERGLTQIELAKHFNISNATIGNYETGDREPDLEMSKKIATFFNISLDELFGLKESDRHVDFADFTRMLNEHGITEDKVNALPDKTKQTIINLFKEIVNNQN